MYAFMNGHTEIARLLKGNQVKTKDDMLEGHRGKIDDVLERRRGKVKISEIKALLYRGIDAQNNIGETALMYASSLGYTDIAVALINVGADVNIKNKNGSTALMYASQQGDTDIVEVLIKAGADVNIKNNYGSTALRYASSSYEVVRLLKAAGAKE